MLSSWLKLKRQSTSCSIQTCPFFQCFCSTNDPPLHFSNRTRYVYLGPHAASRFKTLAPFCRHPQGSHRRLLHSPPAAMFPTRQIPIRRRRRPLRPLDALHGINIHQAGREHLPHHLRIWPKIHPSSSRPRPLLRRRHCRPAPLWRSLVGDTCVLHDDGLLRHARHLQI